jgi:hypothetical protein
VMDKVRSGSEVLTVYGDTPRKALHVCLDEMLGALAHQIDAAAPVAGERVAAAQALAMVPLAANPAGHARDIVIVLVVLDEGKGTPLLQPLREMVTYAVESVHPQTVNPKEVV